LSISLRSKEISLWTALGVVGAALLLGCPAHMSTAVSAEDSDKRYLLGADLYGKGLIPQATEELLKSVQYNPDNAEAHNLLGIIYMRKGVETEDLSLRSQCLRGQALALEKKDSDAEMVKAEREFKEAVRIRNDFSEAYNSLAVVAQHGGRFDEALDAANKALSNIIYREPWAAHLNLGVAYLSKGDYVRAAQSLRKALFDNPKLCVGHWRLAQVYKEQGELDHAREELELLFADKACAGIQEAYQLGGIVALKLGDRARAQELLRQCVALAPKSCLAQQCQVAVP
jgi:Tfp pilus assembly protein PilF